MSRYRRLYVPGGTYFFTVRLKDRRSTLLVDRIDLLRHSVRLAQVRRPFVIDAAVILPSKLHMIWTLPPDDCDFSVRWQQIKSTFSRHVAPGSTTRGNARRGKGIWQPRFWEHMIRDHQDFDLHEHLIATAPLREGVVKEGVRWPYSSMAKRASFDLRPVSAA